MPLVGLSRLFEAMDLNSTTYLWRLEMKLLNTTFFMAFLWAGCLLLASNPARGQSTPILSCEQGAPSSWKLCEVNPDTYSRYVWWVSGGAVLDPYVCTENSSACTAFCTSGSTSGFIHVSVYNASNQLVATRQRSLGCAN